MVSLVLVVNWSESQQRRLVDVERREYSRREIP